MNYNDGLCYLSWPLRLLTSYDPPKRSLSNSDAILNEVRPTLYIKSKLGMAFLEHNS